LKLVATPAQMRECDCITIDEIGIPGIVLMETASRAVAAEVERLLGGNLIDKRVTVFCGKGNNGGDGFACARHLLNRGAEVFLILASPVDSLSGDARTNADLLLKVGGEITCIESVDAIPSEALITDIVVDALLGIGFTGEVAGLYGDLIELIGKMEAPVVSVDIPSGVSGESGKVGDRAVHADATVTFGMLKPGLVLPPGRDLAGEVITADIGIPPIVSNSQAIATFVVESADIRAQLPRLQRDAHKGDAGYVYLLAGSPGLTGAAALAAEAAVRTGAGLVVVGVPRSLNAILETKLTEAMTEPLPETPVGGLSLQAAEQVLARLEWADAIAIGPGLGKDPDTGALLERILPNIQKPLLIDADGLNFLAGKPELLRRLPRHTILTPHPGEFARLSGLSIQEIASDRIGVARNFAAQYNVVLHLKGAPSLTALPNGEVYINPTGNPGMATGGSGDVLTGVIVALLAGGVPSTSAAWVGSYIHGLAGDLAVEQTGTLSLAAGDIVKHLYLSLSNLS